MMDQVREKKKSGLTARLNEAEACQSMGLLKEARGVYHRILADTENLGENHRSKIEERLAQLEDELAEQHKKETHSVGAREISIIKKTLTGGENVPAIIDSAKAFRDLGLYQEAAVEFGKLFNFDHPVDEIVSAVTDCLLIIGSPSGAVKEVDQYIADWKIGIEKAASIKFALGRLMEKRDHKDLALDLYKKAAELAPDDEELKKRLEDLTSSLSSGSRYDYLIIQRMVTPAQLKQAAALAKKMKRSVESILIDHYNVNKQAVGKSLSAFYGRPFMEFDAKFPPPVELLGNLKQSFLLNDHWVPLSWSKSGVEVLIDNPKDLIKIDNIRSLVHSKKIHFSIAIREDINAFIKHFFSESQALGMDQEGGGLDEFDLIPDIAFEEDEEELEIIDDELDASSSKVVKLVDQFIIAAYRKDSSDIHVEPSTHSKATSLRFRVDGVCQDYLRVPNSMAPGIISRLKIMAGLDIAEKRLPQDGKIKFRRRGITPFEIRLATIPTTGGFEDAVLRILPNSGAMELEEMGMNAFNLNILKRIITQPYGMILVVGPTGSGKTTTLHAALKYINKPGVKIWTAEDPVEITQPGLRQVETRPKIGLTFARIMRSFLRADPDIIMIGEMRDEETAAIGIEASLTGHQVFSTLHTNSAPETVTRLLDMGLNPLNFSDAFLCVMAQRLVRRLCTHCRHEYHVPEEEFEEIVMDYGEEYFKATGIEYSSDLTMFRPVGCERCANTGYRGRMGIYELMEGTPEIKRMIKRQASTEALFEQAIKNGMTTLKQDGILKALPGYTDISEVRRVCIT